MQMATNTLDLNQPAIESGDGLAPPKNSEISKGEVFIHYRQGDLIWANPRALG